MEEGKEGRKKRAEGGEVDHHFNLCDSSTFESARNQGGGRRKLLRASQPAMQLIHEPKAAEMKVLIPLQSSRKEDSTWNCYINVLLRFQPR